MTVYIAKSPQNPPIEERNGKRDLCAPQTPDIAIARKTLEALQQKRKQKQEPSMA